MSSTPVMDKRGWLTALRANEVARKQADVEQCDLIAIGIANGFVADYGAASMKDLLVAELRISSTDASARVAVADAVGARRALSGEPLEPVFPDTAAAYRAGVIGNTHVRSIAAVIDALPDEVAVVCDRELERALVEVATAHDPATAARQFGQVRAHFDARGLYDEAAHREARRGVTHTRLPDGSGMLSGNLTPRLSETLDVVLDALARPTRDDTGDDGRDHRSRAQRRHDALLTLCETYLSSGSAPQTGGTRTTVVLHMDVDDFARRDPAPDRPRGTAMATTGHGYAIPVDLAKRWLEPEANAILVLLSKTRGIEAYSSVSRLFSAQQRYALLARDGGCTFPRCDQPLAYTEAHHVTDWSTTGHTRVDDGALLCAGNHRLFERAGWRTRMINGRPHWIPPTWIDEHSTPRRNAVHGLAPP